MAISYATIQWIVKCCSAIQSGLEGVGATVTALLKKSYEGVIVELGKTIDLLLVIVYLTTYPFQCSY